MTGALASDCDEAIGVGAEDRPPEHAVSAVTPEATTKPTTIVERHIGPVPDSVVTSRASSEGHFLALTFAITAESRAQLDALYRELSSCPEILVAL